MSFDPLEGDRVGEEGPAGRDQGRTSFLEGGDRGPPTVDFLDRA